MRTKNAENDIFDPKEKKNPTTDCMHLLKPDKRFKHSGLMDKELVIAAKVM